MWENLRSCDGCWKSWEAVMLIRRFKMLWSSLKEYRSCDDHYKSWQTVILVREIKKLWYLLEELKSCNAKCWRHIKEAVMWQSSCEPVVLVRKVEMCCSLSLLRHCDACLRRWEAVMLIRGCWEWHCKISINFAIFFFTHAQIFLCSGHISFISL